MMRVRAILMRGQWLQRTTSRESRWQGNSNAVAYESLCYMRNVVVHALATFGTCHRASTASTIRTCVHCVHRKCSCICRSPATDCHQHLLHPAQTQSKLKPAHWQ